MTLKAQRQLTSCLCSGFYPIALCVPRAAKGKTCACVNPGLDIIRVSAEKDEAVGEVEGLGKHVVEMIDNNNQTDREEREAGLRLMD